MKKIKSSRLANILFISISLSLIISGFAFASEKKPILTPEEILKDAGENPTPEMIIELFDNVTIDDAAHRPVKDSSRQALINLGTKALPTLVKDYLASEALYHRLEIDNIINGIGNPAIPYLIPFLVNESWYARQHAAYLIGANTAISKQEDLYKIGPVAEDIDALNALESALRKETDWQVIRSLVGAIGAIRDPSKTELIASYLNDKEQAVRITAATALGKIPHKDSLNALLRAFDDPLTTIRQTAILQFATPTNGDIAFDMLINAAKARQASLRSRLCALESLARYLDSTAVLETPQIIEQRKKAAAMATEILSDKTESDWIVRGYAVKIIGNSKQKDLLPFLEKLSESEIHPYVKGRIEIAMMKIGE